MSNEQESYKYPIVLDDDKTLKQFVERFYILPRVPVDYTYKDEELNFLKRYCLELSEPLTRAGKDGFIVYRKKKKLKPEEVAIIKGDTGTQREKAKRYNLSVGTINKIMNDKY